MCCWLSNMLLNTLSRTPAEETIEVYMVRAAEQVAGHGVWLITEEYIRRL